MIEIKNLSKKFGDKVVLDEITLNIEKKIDSPKEKIEEALGKLGLTPYESNFFEL